MIIGSVDGLSRGVAYPEGAAGGAASERSRIDSSAVSSAAWQAAQLTSRVWVTRGFASRASLSNAAAYADFERLLVLGVVTSKSGNHVTPSGMPMRLPVWPW